MSMVFKLLGIAIDRMTVWRGGGRAEVISETPMSDEAPSSEQEIAALRREVRTAEIEELNVE